MNIRTVEQLTDTLSNDLAWRKKELAEVKALVEARNVSDQRHIFFILIGRVLLN
jgi:hypothetical protein